MPYNFLFWNEIVIPLAGMGMGLFILLATIRAVSRHFDRKHEARMAGTQDAGAVQAELQQLRGQVEALEERVDFAERLLTQERNRRPLESGNQER